MRTFDFRRHRSEEDEYIINTLAFYKNVALGRDNYIECYVRLSERYPIDINFRRPEDGCTALHRAAHRGDLELMFYLISKGANPDIVTNSGLTCFGLLNLCHGEEKLKAAITVMDSFSRGETDLLLEYAGRFERRVERSYLIADKCGIIEVDLDRVFGKIKDDVEALSKMGGGERAVVEVYTSIWRESLEAHPSILGKEWIVSR